MTDDLAEAMREAWATLTATGHSADALFGERSVPLKSLASEAAHAFGTIEGAGVALGLTAVELLDELSLLPSDY